MIGTPHWPWLTALLAVAILGDAVISIRPPAFISRCLDGVRFPRDWWWVLVVVKMVAVAGLVTGLKVPGVGFAANSGICVYFFCAGYAHYRARFLGTEFWLNCLGMTVLCVATQVASYAL